MRRIKIAIWSLFALGLLAACGSSTSPPAPAASRPSSGATTAPATNAPATARPAPTTLASQPAAATASQPTAAAQAASIPEGVTAEGYHMLGNPNAPVTLTMYSDFL